MDDAAADIARAAARRLAPAEGSHILGDVETALAGGNRTVPISPIDPVALGALIVSTAQLTWTIIQDRRSRRERPERDQVAHQVRVRVQSRGGSTSSERDHVIDVVIDEAFARDDPAATS